MRLSNFLTILARRTERQGLKIIPLRNYEGFPTTNVGRDIDMVIGAGSLDVWVSTLKAIANDNNLRISSMAQYEYCRQFLIHTIDGVPLEIDLIPRFWWRGIVWLKEQDVIDDAIPYRDFIWRPAEHHEFVVTLNHSYLHGGFYPRKYAARLRCLLDVAEPRITSLLTSVYGQKNTDHLIEMIRLDDFKQLDVQNFSIRLDVIFRYGRHNPLSVANGILSSYAYDYWLRLKRIGGEAFVDRFI